MWYAHTPLAWALNAALPIPSGVRAGAVTSVSLVAQNHLELG
jgi:hypothetical protein